MGKFWHQSQPSRFFRSQVTSVSAGHHFSRENPKNQPTQEFEDYPIIRFNNIENYYRPKCICVFDIVFVFVFDFVFVFLSFCICLLLFIHQRALSGWGSEISLGLLKADDDDEEFYYNTQIGRNPVEI